MIDGEGANNCGTNCFFAHRLSLVSVSEPELSQLIYILVCMGTYDGVEWFADCYSMLFIANVVCLLNMRIEFIFSSKLSRLELGVNTNCNCKHFGGPPPQC